MAAATFPFDKRGLALTAPLSSIARSRRGRFLLTVAATTLFFMICMRNHEYNHYRQTLATDASLNGNSSDNDTSSHDPTTSQPDDAQESPLIPIPNQDDETQHKTHDDKEDDDVDWSRFAYTQYVTDSEYLCNSIMIFETLHRLGSAPDRVMMYPSHMLPDPTAKLEELMPVDTYLLMMARDVYGVKLVPIEVQHRNASEETWQDSYTKLLAFNQTQYSRVLALDSDSTLLQPMDELFLLPPCPVAMPRAYWLLDDSPPKKILSSQVMLIQPSTTEFERIMQKTNASSDNEYDMEIVNDLYLDSAMILPHRPYNMLTAEFRRKDHGHYLGSNVEVWDPAAVYKEAKFIHFSDFPVPKPWYDMEIETRLEMQPECRTVDGHVECAERKIWTEIYDDFRRRRLDLCPHLEKSDEEKKAEEEEKAEDEKKLEEKKAEEHRKAEEKKAEEKKAEEKKAKEQKKAEDGRKAEEKKVEDMAKGDKPKEGKPEEGNPKERKQETKPEERKQETKPDDKLERKADGDQQLRH